MHIGDFLSLNSVKTLILECYIYTYSPRLRTYHLGIYVVIIQMIVLYCLYLVQDVHVLLLISLRGKLVRRFLLIFPSSLLICFILSLYIKVGVFFLCLVQTFLDRPPGTWLLGGGWNNDLWGGELPVASWIDDITPQNPVSVFIILNVLPDLN